MSKTFYDLPENEKLLIQAALRTAGQGSYDQKTVDLFKGIDISGRRQLVPSVGDQDGLVFFGKPQLNLSTDNISADRILVQLTRNNPNSFNAAFRAMLDPLSQNAFGNNALNRLAFGGSDSFTAETSARLMINSNLVDKENPFMSILSNTLTSFTGWPDLVGDVYQSEQGMFRQSTTFLDGTPRLYENRTLTANFQSIQGNPILLLHYFWLYYSLAQAEGIVVPWPMQAITRRINYHSRVFKLILDSQRRHVVGIASAIVKPTSVSMGSWFNHNREDILKADSRDITIQYQTFLGVEYQDPILIEEFNNLVGTYNANMRRVNPNDNDYILKGVEAGAYERLVPSQYDPENFNAYPYIQPATGELQWYAPINRLRQPSANTTSSPEEVLVPNGNIEDVYE